jgi:hypothetical protein
MCCTDSFSTVFLISLKRCLISRNHGTRWHNCFLISRHWMLTSAGFWSGKRWFASSLGLVVWNPDCWERWLLRKMIGCTVVLETANYLSSVWAPHPDLLTTEKIMYGRDVTGFDGDFSLVLR